MPERFTSSSTRAAPAMRRQVSAASCTRFGPRNSQPERLAEADDALAAAQEQQRTLRVEQRQERREVIDRPRLDRQGGNCAGRHCRRGVGHGSTL